MVVFLLFSFCSSRVDKILQLYVYTAISFVQNWKHKIKFNKKYCVKKAISSTNHYEVLQLFCFFSIDDLIAASYSMHCIDMFFKFFINEDQVKYLKTVSEGLQVLFCINFERYCIMITFYQCHCVLILQCYKHWYTLNSLKEVCSS